MTDEGGPVDIKKKIEQAQAATELLLVYFREIDQPFADLSDGTVTAALEQIEGALRSARAVLITSDHH